MMSNLSNFASYMHSQLFITPPPPSKPFTNQTIIVTGANAGMGLEAARHFVRLDAAKVILAVRSVAKGEAAAEDITSSTGRKGVVEVWKLDLERYASVEAFAKRVKRELPRLDVLVANAGVYLFEFQGLAEGDEVSVTVNVVSHMLLAVLVLSKIRETAVKTGKAGVVTFTGSFTHWMTEFPERKAERVFEELADEGRARMGERYYVTKLMQLLTVRELAKELSKSTKPGKVVMSVINPGFVATQIMRHGGKGFQIYLKFLLKTMSRTAEEGGRTLVHAAEGGEETHGQYLNDCKIGSPSAFVLSQDGEQTQKQLWRELTGKLEKIHPGIMHNI